MDRILELPGDGKVHEYLGSYSDYLAHRAARHAVEAGTPEPTAPRAPPPTARQSAVDAASVRESSAELVKAPASAPPRRGEPRRGEPRRGEPRRGEPRRGEPRRARVAVVGLPGVGKRSLVAELVALAGVHAAPREAAAEVVLSDGLSAALDVATATPSDPAALLGAARYAEALLLLQDLADTTLRQVAALRSMLTAGGIVPVPQPLPVAIRPRAKGGLEIVGTEDPALRDALTRWCRARQITHAEVSVRAALAAAEAPLYADAAWQRAGGGRARQQPAQEGALPLVYRPALVVGTRYDERDDGAGGLPPEDLLRGAMPGFGCVAVSAFDLESVERLRAALITLLTS